jgi:hypothetical protein
MRKIKFMSLVVFILFNYACYDDTNPESSKEIDLSLENLKKSLPQSLFSADKLIYLDKDGKEIEVKLTYFETISDEVHNTGLKYKREDFVIHLTNEVLNINTSLAGASELAYGDVSKESYTIAVGSNNGNNDTSKNIIALSYLDNTKSFFPDGFISHSVNEETLFGTDFKSVMKSKRLSEGEVGTRFNNQFGIISIVDNKNNMYIIKTK